MADNRFKQFVKIYKVHIIIWVIGLIVLGNFVYKKVTSPTYLLNGILLGSEKGKDEAAKLAEDFAVSIGYGDTVYAVNLDTRYSYTPNNKDKADDNFKATEAIITQHEAEQLDFVIGPQTSMLDIAYNAYFTELSTYFSAQQYELLKPYILYIDQAVMTQLEDAYENKEDLSSIALPDPTRPDEMKEPVAVLIDFSSIPEIAAIYADLNEPAVMGIMTEAPNSDMLLKFISYLTNENKGE